MYRTGLDRSSPHQTDTDSDRSARETVKEKQLKDMEKEKQLKDMEKEKQKYPPYWIPKEQ